MVNDTLVISGVSGVNPNDALTVESFTALVGETSVTGVRVRSDAGPLSASIGTQVSSHVVEIRLDEVYISGIRVETSGGDDVVEIATGLSVSATLNGGSGHDELHGGDMSDVLSGDGGNDTLNGAGGGDSLLGGDGDDVMIGGAGNDTVRGGLGYDRWQESGDVDFLLSDNTFQGLGNDFVGLDVVESVLLEGGSGHNRIDATAYTRGPVTLLGGQGNDTLLGNAVPGSILDGGAGDDRLSEPPPPPPPPVIVSISDATVNEGDRSLTTLFESTGSAVFSGAIRNVVSADFNGDARQDYATERMVFINNGPGEAFSNQPITSSGRGFLAAGDVDADGDVDLIIPSEDVEIVLNNGDGTFQASQLIDIPSTGRAAAVNVADYNGDARLDIALAYAAENTVTLLLGAGFGAFEEPTFFTVGTAGTADIESVDFDRDGDVDMALIKLGGSPRVEFMRNNGTAQFAQFGALNPHDGAASSIASGDFDRDGDVDFVVTGAERGRHSILQNNGFGILRLTLPHYQGPPANDVEVGDLNADGLLDFVTMSDGGQIAAFLNSGMEEFNNPIFFSAQSQGNSDLALLDKDDDGDLDIVVTTYDPANDSSGVVLLTSHFSEVPVARFSISLSGPQSSAVRLSVWTHDTSAEAGVDYLSVSSWLTFAPGETSKLVGIPVFGDRDADLDKNFLVTVSPEAYAPIQTAVAQGFVVDDDGRLSDTLPTLYVGDAVPKFEGNSGMFPGASFPVRLSNAPTSNVSVRYYLIGGASGDTFNVNGTLSFSPTSLTQIVDVTISGDNTIEPDERFFLVLTDVSGNVTLTDSYGIGTILNDDSQADSETILLGGTGNDTLTGSQYRDSLDGGADADSINGSGGGDLLIGGDGNDTLVGDAGNDSLAGADGNDVLEGRDDNDTLLGGLGDDVLRADDGNDLLTGAAGVDQLFGGTGADVLREGGDVHITINNTTLSTWKSGDPPELDSLADIELLDLTGGPSRNRIDASGFVTNPSMVNTIVGGGGVDTILGTNSRDRITTYSTRSDSISGLGGNDTIFSGMGNDTVDGGAGDDLIQGQDGDDSILGGEGDDALHGNAGNDVLSGGAGADWIQGTQGYDHLFGDHGNDSLLGDAGDDSLTGGAGNDLLRGSIGQDSLDGGAGAWDRVDEAGDTNFTVTGMQVTSSLFGTETPLNIERFDLSGGPGANRLDARQSSVMVILNGIVGDDTLEAGAFNDLVFGGDGHDVLNGGDGNDSLQGNDGDDSLLGTTGDDSALGGYGHDTLDGGTGNDVLRGQDGNDSLLGGDGDDTASGGNGNDTLDGGIGNDGLAGRAGDDVLLGMDGGDMLLGGTGKDTLLGAAWNDILLGGEDDDWVDGQGASRDTVAGGDGDDTVMGSASEIDETFVLNPTLLAMLDVD